MYIVKIDPTEPRVGLKVRWYAAMFSTSKQQSDAQLLALIKCAPSTLPVAPFGTMKPLRLACMIIELGRFTDAEA